MIRFEKNAYTLLRIFSVVIISPEIYSLYGQRISWLSIEMFENNFDPRGSLQDDR